jgi:histidine triad (HIT) family protein
MEENCIFCRIVKGEIPAYKVYENEDVIAFLDAFPTVLGQSLVIPKKHLAPKIYELDEEIYTKIMLTSKKIASAVDKAFKPIKTGIVVEGLELDHVHVKIYPLGKDGLKALKRIELTKEEMQQAADKIKENL